MVIEWLAPALTAYKHRDDLTNLLKGGMAWLFGKKTNLAFTGMEGVGKTVLLDHLTGKAFRPGYQLPLRSQREEFGRLSPEAVRLQVTVIPGQKARPRRMALDKLFRGKSPVDGVVHVVGNGLATIRDADSIHFLVRRRKVNTLAKYRKYTLERELDDLSETTKMLRESHHEHRKPTWLLVAVDKIDLYFNALDRAREYYSPNADSPFADQLRVLASQIGTDNFRWEVVPVCGCLDPFSWRTEELLPQFNSQQRDAFLAQFLRVLESYAT